MSFDLETARVVCDKIKRKNWNIDDGIDIRYLNIQCAEILPAALDEIDRQANRIAELEDALVEERARGNHYGMSYEDASDGEIERWIIDGEIDAPKVYIERMRMESRAQLRREGKL